jgi:hypothetical protein
MNDDLRAWLAPLYAASQERGFELSAEILIACKPPEGRLSAPMNWELFGQLLIQRLGWEDDYPPAPKGERRPYLRVIK